MSAAQAVSETAPSSAPCHRCNKKEPRPPHLWEVWRGSSRRCGGMKRRYGKTCTGPDRCTMREPWSRTLQERSRCARAVAGAFQRQQRRCYRSMVPSRPTGSSSRQPWLEQALLDLSFTTNYASGIARAAKSCRIALKPLSEPVRSTRAGRYFCNSVLIPAGRFRT